MDDDEEIDRLLSEFGLGGWHGGPGRDAPPRLDDADELEDEGGLDE